MIKRIILLVMMLTCFAIYGVEYQEKDDIFTEADNITLYTGKG